jgi:hypothetical protein
VGVESQEPELARVSIARPIERPQNLWFMESSGPARSLNDTAQLAGFGFANLMRLGATRRGPEYPVTSPNRRRSSQSVRASAIS